MEKVIAFLALIGLIAVPVGLIWLIYNFVKKKKKALPIATIVIGAVVFFLGSSALPDTENSAETVSTTTKEQSSDAEDSEDDEVEEDEDLDLDDAEDYVDYDNVDTSDYDEIAYDDLARNPEDHEGDLITLTGTVIQVIEDEDYPEYRLAVDDDYDDIILLEIPSELIDSRILEDDVLTFYGESLGTIDYESTSGEPVTIPAAAVHKFEM